MRASTEGRKDVAVLLRALSLDAGPGFSAMLDEVEQNLTRFLVKVDQTPSDAVDWSTVEQLLGTLRSSLRQTMSRSRRRQRATLHRALAEIEKAEHRFSGFATNHSDSRSVVDRTGEAGLVWVASRYSRDAERDTELAVRISILSVALVVAASGLATYQAPRLDGAFLSPEAILSIAPIAFGYASAGLGFFQASKIKRGVDDMRRLERQLLTLNPYLATLPEQTSSLIRAALAQRMFPRLITDDPLRDEDWFPDGDSVLASIMPDLAKELLAPDEE